MTTNTLNTSASVKLDGTGHGQVKLGPNVGVRWTVSNAAIRVPNAVNIPQCRLYIGATATDDNLVDGTYSGDLNSTDTLVGVSISAGVYVWAVWDGGDANAVATLSLFGQAVSP